MDADHQQRCLNFCVISQLLQKAAENFHTIFRERWIIFQNLNNSIKKWNDNEISGNELVKLESFLTIAPGMKEKLKTGKVDLWDISLSCMAIEAVNKKIHKLGGKTNKDENNIIFAIRNVRNEIAHGNSELSNEEFSEQWNFVAESLIKLGDDASEIEKLKTNFLKIGESQGNVKSDYIKLKKQAKNLLKMEQYTKAIEVCTKMLELPKLTPEKQAAIFGNRSFAYLKLKTPATFELAKIDAEYAVQLWPCWWKAYYFLGETQIALEELKNAEKSLEKALALNPKAEDVAQVFSFVRQQNGHILYHENKDLVDSVKTRRGFTEQEADKLVEVLQNAPCLGNLHKGHQYNDGDGVPQDFTKAANYYHIAAKEGVPDGMYYYAICLKEGKGVRRDNHESLRWLFKAANEEAHKHKGDEGVKGAQHTLGLLHEKGDGVKQDYSKAIYWYKKAIKNGYGGSANNLGAMYQKGTGVQQSDTEGFRYYKLAAELGDAPGMQNVAHCYLASDGTGHIAPTEKDIVEGIKWLEIYNEKMDEEKRQGQPQTNIWTYKADVEAIKSFLPKNEIPADPLNKQLYEKKVQIAANNGSLTAQKMLNIWKYMDEAAHAVRSNNPAKLVENLSKAYEEDFRILESKVPERFTDMAKKRFIRKPYELQCIISNIETILSERESSMKIFEYCKKFQENDLLTEMCAVILVQLNDEKLALMLLDAKLQANPSNLQFLFYRAIVLSLRKEQTPECLKAWDDFLDAAPEDNEKVPDCYYRKAKYFCSKKDMDSFVKAFEKGLEAEKKQLACFQPYTCPNKVSLMKHYIYQKIKNPNLVKREMKVEKSIFVFPSKKNLLIEHRTSFISDKRILNGTFPPKEKYSGPKVTPPHPITLTKITFMNMDHNVTKSYDGCILHARIIDWPFLSYGINTLIEDKNGNVMNLTVFNWTSNETWKENVQEMSIAFRLNGFMSIVNPILQKENDKPSKIMVNNRAFISFNNTLSEVKCSVCGEYKKILKCSKCFMSRYCSKECQKIDWIEYDHKKVCSYLKNYLN